MPATQMSLNFATPAQPILKPQPASPAAPAATGLKGKARDLIAAIRTLKTLEAEQRPATDDEKLSLEKFVGFGTLAKELFPDPVTGRFKESWQTLGEELKSLLNRDEYDSAKRTTFNAFYSAPIVMQAMFDGLTQLGLPQNGTILESGCGPGRFITAAPPGHRFIGVELDSLSGRIAKALHPEADIRIENFRDSRLPALDGVVGNVPFADVTLDYRGNKFPLHDYFFAKSVDALKPGGVLALVTSRYTLDKLDSSLREYLADEADFVGAIRLPSNAFTSEGTKVITDIVFQRKREPGAPAHHVDDAWLKTGTLALNGQSMPVNQYFLNHPEMVLGRFTTENTLYGQGLTVDATGDLKSQLHDAVEQLPRFTPGIAEETDLDDTPLDFVAPPAQMHINEGSFFVGPDRRIYQQHDSQGVPVVYGGSELTAYGGMVGRRIADLVGLRDQARQVLRSQNEGWPEPTRESARHELRQQFERFVSLYGPINKTTFSNSADGSTIRRMPNCVKFREDPDAYLVFSLEEYDEVTGIAKPAPILLKDVVGPTPPVTHVASAQEGLLVSLNTHGKVFIDYISKLYAQPEAKVIDELGDLIYRDPITHTWETTDAYLSGNVRDKLVQAMAAGGEYARNVMALEAVQPPDVLPGDIDAELGSPWIPESDIKAFAADLFRVEPSSLTIAHLKKDALWNVEADTFAKSSVAATTEFGTPRANGVWLLELALNLKSPTIYDTIEENGKEIRVVNQEETLAAREKQKLIKEKFKSWVFADPDRTERLVRLYNDAYNSIRPRAFDGGHLDFPGMNTAVHLRDHQKNAVWRGMSAGNTLLAHHATEHGLIRELIQLATICP